MTSYREEFPREFWEKVQHRRIALNQRYGQAVYNTAYEMWPKLVTPLNATIHDPFHHDEKVVDFLRILADRKRHHEIPNVLPGEE